ncbi:MAG: peptidyl-prolyl cis-trans isomerase [Alphaproteobacteria bacterium]|nr:peptidyl-prolyl cis-trans isomerase [Alphaproteobacteria bacterium]
MRQVAHSWVVKGLMLFLIVSFSIWGIGDIFRGNSLRRAVATVGDTEISVQELNILFEKTLAQARQALSPGLTAQQARQLGLLDHALDREINSRLIDMEVARQNISVGPEAVLDLLASEPQFRTKDGSFNKALFRQFLDQQRLSESAFLVQEQQELARQILLSAVQGGAVAPEAAVNALFKARAQKRIVEVATVDPAKLGGIPTPDDKALQTFYDGHQQLFAIPEYRSITLAILSTEALSKDISISEEDLKKEYETRKEQLADPEKRDVLQVVLQSEEKAKELATQAHASNDLASAAKAQKETAVPLDKLEKKSLMPELSDAAFALHEGAIGGPVKTQLGWHVIQLKKIIPGGIPDFDKIKDKLRDDLRREQAIEVATRVVNQLDDQLAAGHSLDDIADDLRLRIVKIPAVDANGQTPEGKDPSELPNKEQVLKDAFAQNAGETGPVEDTKSGVYYVVRTDDVTPSGVQPFDKVKAKVASAWKEQEQKTKAQAKAGEIAKALNGGEKLLALEGQEGVSTRISRPISKLGETDKDLPPALAARVFQLKQGEAMAEESDGKQYIIRLVSVTNVDPSKPDPHKSGIANEIRKAEHAELLEQYLDHLQEIFPVKKNVAVLDSMRQRDEQ